MYIECAVLGLHVSLRNRLENRVKSKYSMFATSDQHTKIIRPWGVSLGAGYGGVDIVVWSKPTTGGTLVAGATRGSSLLLARGNVVSARSLKGRVPLGAGVGTKLVKPTRW